MEQHPIPQNITGFEFKLIGEMTVKQFAYLVVCVILAYIVWVIPLYAILKWPLIFILVLLGIGLAFVPVQGRPLDKWLMNFIKALFAPSQYIFHKEGTEPDFFAVTTTTVKATQAAKPSIQDQSQTRLHQLLSQTVPNSQPSQVSESVAKLAAYDDLFKEVPQQSPPAEKETPKEELKESPTQSAAQSPTPSTQVQNEVQVPITPIHAELVAPTPSTSPTPPIHEHVSFLMDENKKLRKELEVIKAHVLGQKEANSSIPSPTPEATATTSVSAQIQPSPAASPVSQPVEPVVHTESITATTPAQKPIEEHLPSPTIPSARPFVASVQPLHTPTATQPVEIQKPAVPAKVAKTAAAYSPLKGSAPLEIKPPSFPNIISGIVKNEDGEGLPSIIVEVKDAQDIPVRAFKTNAKGQFAAATALTNGTYTIEVEDPRNFHTFDKTTITVDGTILSPVTIVGKGQKDAPQSADPARNQLHAALFGGAK